MFCLKSTMFFSFIHIKLYYYKYYFLTFFEPHILKEIRIKECLDFYFKSKASNNNDNTWSYKACFLEARSQIIIKNFPYGYVRLIKFSLGISIDNHKK